MILLVPMRYSFLLLPGFFRHVISMLCICKGGFLIILYVFTERLADGDKFSCSYLQHPVCW